MARESSPLKALMDLARGYMPAKVVTTAAVLGLLTPPFETETPEVLSIKRQISEKGARTLLNALVSLGFFEKKGEAYSVERKLRQELERSPEMVWDLIHQDHLYGVWNRLETGVRTGKSPDPPKEELDRYPATLEVFLRAMHAHARTLFPDLAASLSWEGVHDVLDIGGGGAGFALSLLQASRSLTVTLLDLPDAISLTRSMITGCPEADRLVLKVGNAYADPLPEGPFDRVLISHLIHIYPEGDNQKLIKKAAACLSPGGELLLLDFFLDEEETAPRESVFFRLLMLVGTPEGDCYPLSAAHAWVEHTGLVFKQIVSLAGGNTLLIAEKP